MSFDPEQMNQIINKKPRKPTENVEEIDDDGAVISTKRYDSIMADNEKMLSKADAKLLAAIAHDEIKKAKLTAAERDALPDEAFCGPDRSFPVHDRAHLTAARRLLGRSHNSEEVKAKIRACIERKAAAMNKADAPLSTATANARNVRYDDESDEYDEVEGDKRTGDGRARPSPHIIAKARGVARDNMGSNDDQTNAVEEQGIATPPKVNSQGARKRAGRPDQQPAPQQPEPNPNGPEAVQESIRQLESAGEKLSNVPVEDQRPQIKVQSHGRYKTAKQQSYEARHPGAVEQAEQAPQNPNLPSQQAAAQQQQAEQIGQTVSQGVKQGMQEAMARIVHLFDDLRTPEKRSPPEGRSFDPDRPPEPSKPAKVFNRYEAMAEAERYKPEYEPPHPVYNRYARPKVKPSRLDSGDSSELRRAEAERRKRFEEETARNVAAAQKETLERQREAAFRETGFLNGVGVSDQRRQDDERRSDLNEGLVNNEVNIRRNRAIKEGLRTGELPKGLEGDGHESQADINRRLRRAKNPSRFNRELTEEAKERVDSARPMPTAPRRYIEDLASEGEASSGMKGGANTKLRIARDKVRAIKGVPPPTSGRIEVKTPDEFNAEYGAEWERRHPGQRFDPKKLEGEERYDYLDALEAATTYIDPSEPTSDMVTDRERELHREAMRRARNAGGAQKQLQRYYDPETGRVEYRYKTVNPGIGSGVAARKDIKEQRRKDLRAIIDRVGRGIPPEAAKLDIIKLKDGSKLRVWRGDKVPDKAHVDIQYDDKGNPINLAEGYNPVTERWYRLRPTNTEKGYYWTFNPNTKQFEVVHSPNYEGPVNEGVIDYHDAIAGMDRREPTGPIRRFTDDSASYSGINHLRRELDMSDYNLSPGERKERAWHEKYPERAEVYDRNRADNQHLIQRGLELAVKGGLLEQNDEGLVEAPKLPNGHSYVIKDRTREGDPVLGYFRDLDELFHFMGSGAARRDIKQGTKTKEHWIRFDPQKLANGDYELTTGPDPDAGYEVKNARPAPYEVAPYVTPDKRPGKNPGAAKEVDELIGEVGDKIDSVESPYLKLLGQARTSAYKSDYRESVAHLDNAISYALNRGHYDVAKKIHALKMRMAEAIGDYPTKTVNRPGMSANGETMRQGDYERIDAMRQHREDKAKLKYNLKVKEDELLDLIERLQGEYDDAKTRGDRGLERHLEEQLDAARSRIEALHEENRELRNRRKKALAAMPAITVPRESADEAAKRRSFISPYEYSSRRAILLKRIALARSQGDERLARGYEQDLDELDARYEQQKATAKARAGKVKNNTKEKRKRSKIAKAIAKAAMRCQ